MRPTYITLTGLAEGVGFEPTRACALPVFKTGAINHSTTPPSICDCEKCAIAPRFGKVLSRLVRFAEMKRLDRAVCSCELIP